MKAILEHKITLYIFALFVFGAVLICIKPPDIMWAMRGVEFAAQLMLGLLGLGLLFLIINQRRLMVVSLIGSAFLAFFLKNASNSNIVLPNPTTLPKITIAHINLSSIEDDFDQIIDHLQKNQVDVVSFQELKPEWDILLKEKIEPLFPYKKSKVQIDAFGMGIYSTMPMTSKEIFNFSGRPNISISVNKEGQRIYVFSSYILPTITRKSIALGQEQLNFVADRINKTNAPTISLGDFNKVYWSNEIIDFRRKANLGNSRRNSSPTSLAQPYDHIFYTQEIECIFFEDLRDKNQNHLGVVGTYQIKALPDQG